MILLIAMAAVGWCRRNRRGAVLMSESQRRDFARSQWKEWVKRQIMRFYDAAIVGGKSHQSYIKELGMPPERIFIGQDVVDNEFWASNSAQVRPERDKWQKQLDLPDKYFLTACRLVEKKNVSGLLRAYSKYVSKVSIPWPLVIVGDGPLRGEMEELAKTLGVDENVRFMGYLSSEQLAPVYALATVFILASAYSEQWGLVVNEAMAAGLPVLVSNICGCVPDLVVEGITGYSFDPTNEDGLASLLERCSSGKIGLSLIGQAAQRHIQHYSPEYFAKNLIAASEAAQEHARYRANYR